MKIVARSYDKFFNINEVEDTRFNNLEYKFKFPVAAYVKENGYLGLISYNEETDDLFFATKSDCGEGPYKKWLIEAFDKDIDPVKRLQIKDYCKDNNCTLVFENVDMENDPHIIKYDKSTLYLLYIIHNDIKYSKFSYDTVKQFAGLYGLNCKKLAKEFSNWVEFYDWYNEVTKEDEYRFNDRLIEGFVLEDSAGFMTKLKLNYYNFWKFMRSVSHEVINKGYITDTQKLVTPLANYYYGWLKKWCESIPDKNERKKKIPTEIITLRDKFYQEFDINNY
jgi:tRNA splicing ligase